MAASLILKHVRKPVEFTSFVRVTRRIWLY